MGSRSRCCSRTACKHPPVYTLTYVYRDSTAVLGPLAAYVEPHSYDLCEKHAARLVAPRGWDVVRLPIEPVAGPALRPGPRRVVHHRVGQRLQVIGPVLERLDRQPHDIQPRGATSRAACFSHRS